jgi:hypothetical protein
MSTAEPGMVVLDHEDETFVRMFMADFLDEAKFKALTVLQARPDVQVGSPRSRSRPP